MATTLWANVYLHDRLAGVLAEEPGRIYNFTYNQSFLESRFHEISQTMPLREGSYRSHGALHPYFDNLIAEGWLAHAQAKALGVNPSNRLNLLLGFGHDLIGAIRIEDPEERQINLLFKDKENTAALTSRASLSGMQPKVFLIQVQKNIRVAQYGERSTHIGKLELGTIPDLVDIEYLSLKMLAFLLPTEPVAEATINHLAEVNNTRALVIKRFDRGLDGSVIHFEEFNQLLGKNCNDKYDGAYHVMAEYIRSNDKCAIVDVERLFRRILANLIIGNTDAHFKNFGMMYSNNGSRLSLCPSYDIVGAGYYPQYQNIALAVASTVDLSISDLKYKHFALLADSFGLHIKILDFALQEIEAHFAKAISKLEKESCVTEMLRMKFIDYLRKKMEQYQKFFEQKFSWEVVVRTAVQRRKELGFTQKRLALLANVSTPTISRFENNNDDIKLSSALAIIKVLGV